MTSGSPKPWLSHVIEHKVEYLYSIDDFTVPFTMTHLEEVLPVHMRRLKSMPPAGHLLGTLTSVCTDPVASALKTHPAIPEDRLRLTILPALNYL